MTLIDHSTVQDAEVFDGVFSKQVVNKKVGGSAAITVGELKIKPGATLPLHKHYMEEALIIIEGQGKVISEGETYDIKPNMTFLARASSKHEIVNTGKVDLRIYYAFPGVEVERVLI